MGLDMYLMKHIWIGGEYEHRNVTGSVDINADGKRLQMDAKEISEIVCRVGYWRKANQIHKWFVDNVQTGADDCKSYYVSAEQLQKLKTLCQKALDTKDASILPPQDGFFFGGTEFNGWYWGNLRATIAIIEKLPEDGYYYYQSSW
jgi:hypothetical protein